MATGSLDGSPGTGPPSGPAGTAACCVGASASLAVAVGSVSSSRVSLVVPAVGSASSSRVSLVVPLSSAMVDSLPAHAAEIAVRRTDTAACRTITAE